jgi:sugar lactone lactonase YvrE
MRLLLIKCKRACLDEKAALPAALMILCLLVSTAPAIVTAEAPTTSVPTFKVDPFWPALPLPNNWALGELAGVSVDAQDHIWVLHRPGTLRVQEKRAAEKPPTAVCCVPAPPVIEFDPSGKVLRAWGGPGRGYEWPVSEHGITVDYKGNIWIGGSSGLVPGTPHDGMVLKFTADGKFLMQIGHGGPPKGSLDPTQLGGVSDAAVDPKSNEVLMADGYINHRIIVFDADSGKFKRFWGAYGKAPTDLELPPYRPSAPLDTQFRIAHCIKLSKDRLLYVCDRNNDRIQVYRLDGTFIEEHIYMKDTLNDVFHDGAVSDIAFWPDARQSMMINADMANSQIRILRRADGQLLSTFGHFGNYAGQFNSLHSIAVDSKGNLYAAESEGRRVQKFVPTGAVP